MAAGMHHRYRFAVFIGGCFACIRQAGCLANRQRVHIGPEHNNRAGDCPVSDVNNSVLKGLVVVMSKAGLSAKSIENYIQVPKMVVASVLDEDGNEVYPRKWNNEFIDMPIVEES